MSALDYASAMFVAGLLGLERKAFLQAAFSRPIVAGPLVGLAMGHPLAGLAIGSALELFFLSAVALGAALPDNELFATTAATSCACGLLAAAPDPAGHGQLVLAVALMLPAGRLGRGSDRWALRVNARAAGEALAAGPVDARLQHNVFGIWTPFVATAAVTLAGGMIGSELLSTVWRWCPPPVHGALALGWPALLVASAAVAVRSIRVRHAGRLAVGGLLAAVVVRLLAGLLSGGALAWRPSGAP